MLHVASQLVSVTDPLNRVTRCNIYSYDNLNRLTRITQQGIGGIHHEVAEKRVDFTYDAASQIDTITRYADLAGMTAVATTNYDFDKAGRLSSIEHHEGGSLLGDLLAGYGYTFDHRSRLVAIDFLPSAYDDEDVDYTYDNRHQLIDAAFGDSDNDENYVYDDNGNRDTVTNTAGVDQEYTTGDDNRLLEDEFYTYEYDNEGNRTKTTEKSTGNYTVYVWDHRNRLIAVEDYDSSDDLTQKVEYTYDANNRLFKRVVDTDGDLGSATPEKTILIHDMGQIVLQLDKATGDDLTKNDLSHRYLWGPGANNLLVDEAVSDLFDAEENDTLHALPDHLGSIRDLVSYDPIAEETVLRKHTSFDSFGRTIDEVFHDKSGDPIASSHAEAVEQLFMYTGAMRDGDTGLQNHWNRWYDTATGSWLSVDPIKDGVNWYGYVGNSPTSWIDPNGLEAAESAESAAFGQFLMEHGNFFGAYSIYQGTSAVDLLRQAYEGGWTVQIGGFWGNSVNEDTRTIYIDNYSGGLFGSGPLSDIAVAKALAAELRRLNAAGKLTPPDGGGCSLKDLYVTWEGSKFTVAAAKAKGQVRHILKETGKEAALNAASGGLSKIDNGADAAKAAKAAQRAKQAKAATVSVRQMLSQLKKVGIAADFDEMVEFFQSAYRLRLNMLKAGQIACEGDHAHHIVAKARNIREAQLARNLMARLGVSTENALNGVFLPGSFHAKIHTAEYYRNVWKRLQTATDAEDLAKRLVQIRQELMDGTFPY